MKDTRNSPYHDSDKRDKLIQDLLVAIAVVGAMFFCCYMYVTGH